MGIFNKTDEERRIEEENKKLSLLISYIWESNFPEEQKRFLANFVANIKRGFPNAFDDVDTLIRIIDKLLKSSFNNEIELENHMNALKEAYAEIVDKNSMDYERAKALFIEDFVGSEGCLEQDIYDSAMYAVFKDKMDYLELLHRIMYDEVYMDHTDLIYEYTQKVSKYCLNQDVLKRDVLAFIEGLSTVLDDDYEKYMEEQFENAKRRIGVYNISTKSLASVDTKLRRVEGYLDQFGTYIATLKEEKQAVNSLIESGKKEIQKETSSSIEQLKRMIEEQKGILLQKLDEYLLELEELLKNKSDETFREILATYQKQVSDFRNLFKGYSMAASKDLIAIQQATQESIQTLQNYVSNEPQLQDLLHKAQEQNTVREKIVELVTKEEELLQAAQKTASEQIVIPGYERVMVPYRHLILPEQISSSTNQFLDESIPFEIRQRELEKRMKEKEQQGEIYHKKVKEIAIDVMEGDWPYLWGPSGTGKSFMIKQVSELLQMDFMKAGKITEPYSILGYNDPQGRFCITPTFIAVLYGYLLSLDEFDNGNPDTQVVLNDIYSELLNKMENPQDICEVMFGTDIPVDVHPNFRMIAAGNTSGEGENSIFSSRGKIDESIQERQTPIYIDYDNRVEEQILKNYPTWYKFIVDFRKACADYAEKNGIEAPQGTTTTRDAAAIRKYIEHESKTVDQIIAEKFIQIKDSEYRKALGKAIATMYGFDYANCKNPEQKSIPLKEVDEKTLAKKFVYYCKKGVR